METIGTVLNIFVPAAIVFAGVTGGLHFLSKERVYRCYPSGWLDVKSHPIPEDIEDFIATDGNKVSCLYKVTWGPHGEVLFDRYRKTYITHWQPLPEAPK